MKTRKLTLVSLSILMLLSLLLGACAAPTATEAPGSEETGAEEPEAPAAGEKTTIKVMTFLAYDTPEVEPNIAAEFMKEHPEIVVEIESVPFADYFTKLKTLIAGGAAPDVVSLNVENLPTFAALGALADLSPFIEGENYDTGIYFPSTIQMSQYEGKQYGLPASFSTVVIFYNKSLFD